MREEDKLRVFEVGGREGGREASLMLCTHRDLKDDEEGIRDREEVRQPSGEQGRM